VYQPAVAVVSGLDARHSSLVTRHCSFVLAGNNEAAFRVAGYDAKRALVIDPVLSYSTYLGGSGGDEMSSIAVDSSGNVYVAGSTTSIDFPTANPLQPTNRSCEPPISMTCEVTGGGGDAADAVVAKLNAAGSALVYSTYLGGYNSDWGSGIAVDSSGNAYVTGMTASTDFPTANPLQATNKAAPNYTGFVAKLNPAGSALVYSTYLGGSGADEGNGIAVDAVGNAYVTGGTSSTDFPTANPLQGTNHGGSDAFVAKLNAAGSALVYSTYLGGSGSDSGSGISVDSSGNAYVTGGTSSTDFPTADPLQATNHGGGDAFVAKLDAAGSALVYSTYLGGSGGDVAYGIAVDSADNAYVAGATGSSDFPTVNPLQAFNVSRDVANEGGCYSWSPYCGITGFVAKLSPAPAAASLSTSSLSFGGVLVNATSPEQSVTLT